MKLHFPKIPRDSARSWFNDGEIGEQLKIIAELREKYAEELRTASGWRRCLISLRIRLEADRILRHRLYLTKVISTRSNPRLV